MIADGVGRQAGVVAAGDVGAADSVRRLRCKKIAAAMLRASILRWQIRRDDDMRRRKGRARSRVFRSSGVSSGTPGPPDAWSDVLPKKVWSAYNG